ncbi:MAG TPA: DUF1905 domain-containing protein [Candidatus Nanopelagicales bacterium]
MRLDVTGDVWFWRGPSPYHFVTVDDDASAAIKAASAAVTYGWGMIPVTAQVGVTEWTTSLFPKDGRYLVPLKDKVREAEDLDVGDAVTVRLLIDV